jgi:hypothetical protein
MKRRTKKPQHIDFPYLADPADLRALGLDPDVYLKSLGSGAGWLLDRKKDAALIGRLQSMHEPHASVQ